MTTTARRSIALTKTWLASVAALLVVTLAACSSGSATAPTTSAVVPTNDPPPMLDTAQVAKAVTRSSSQLLRAVAPINRCGSDIERCTAADQQTAQAYVSAVRAVANDVHTLQGSPRVPGELKAVLDATATAADAVVAVATPDAGVLACGPGSRAWPEGQGDCASRYQALARAALVVTDLLGQWDERAG